MSAVRIDVDLATDDENSLATRDQLRRLLDHHDLTDWVWTDRVIIDRSAIPHSHPVLTLHTRCLGEDDLLLATFLHEQLHWFLMTLPDERAFAVMDELRGMFPDVPVEPPDGCGDEESTYLHLVVNYLELIALRRTIGRSRAEAVIEHWTTDHYRWVYRTVLDRERELGQLVERYGLLPSGAVRAEDESFPAED